ncbi:MAG TPA: discoidin domain-containing protein [Chitinivibrionales bacterium]|nr:discoidin domain-containing protein [Chitinivibrionales bacterium]
MKIKWGGLVNVAAVVGCVTALGSMTEAARVDIALHKTATADSYATGNTPNKAVDSIWGGGGVGQSSRWENNWSAENPDVDTVRGNAWLCIDLGAIYSVDSVAIYWEHSGSANYKIQAWAGTDTPTAYPPLAANCDSNWTTLIRDTTLTYNATADMCLSFLKLPTTNTRYVRMHSYKRIFSWGVSIIEFMIFGTPSTATQPNPEMRHSPAGLSLINTKSGVQIKSGNLHVTSAEIVSPSGQMIRHLSGSEASLWNYKDVNGRNVPNGTYFIKVSAGGNSLQGKVAVYR